MKYHSSIPRGFVILCDSAFTAGRDVEEKIVKGRNSNVISNVNSTLLPGTDLIIQQVLSSERQSAEWGVRALKKTFALLRLSMSRESIT